MMQGWCYVESLTGQRYDRVQTESQELQQGQNSCSRLQFGFQFGLYHVIAPLSFLPSISLASLFASLSIFGWSDLLEIQRKQAAFSFLAVRCIIMLYWLLAKLLFFVWKCRFSRLQKSPKFDTVAAILNSAQQPSRVFVMSFHSRDMVQMMASTRLLTLLWVMAALEPNYFEPNMLQTSK